MATKTIVGIMFGGRSTEHEISCRSASFLFRHIDWSRYQVAAIAVGKNGHLMAQNVERIRQEDADVVRICPDEIADGLSLQLARYLTGFAQGAIADRSYSADESSSAFSFENEQVVIFSIMHGTYGEDGCWQGCFELANVAYVGPDVLGSAVAMDKVIAKQLVAQQGVPIVDYLAFTYEQWQLRKEAFLQEACQQLGEHIFVKPARLGSSVGIVEVKAASNAAILQDAISESFSFDEKILLERAMKVREIEFGALGGYVPEISLPGEVASHAEFYSYESKYQDSSSAEVFIPAPLPAEQIELGRRLAAQVFEALGLHGMARIDLFYDESQQRFYFNEANTLPGFTSISQYPMLWKHMGLSEQQLIDRLLEAGLSRWQRTRKLRRSFS